MITGIGRQIAKLFHCYKTNSGLPVERLFKSLIDLQNRFALAFLSLRLSLYSSDASKSSDE